MPEDTIYFKPVSYLLPRWFITASAISFCTAIPLLFLSPRSMILWFMLLIGGYVIFNAVISLLSYSLINDLFNVSCIFNNRELVISKGQEERIVPLKSIKEFGSILLPTYKGGRMMNAGYKGIYIIAEAERSFIINESEDLINRISGALKLKGYSITEKKHDIELLQINPVYKIKSYYVRHGQAFKSSMRS